MPGRILRGSASGTYLRWSAPRRVSLLRTTASTLGFQVLYLPGVPPDPVGTEVVEMQRAGTSAADYSRLILAPDRQQFIATLSVGSGGVLGNPAQIATATYPVKIELSGADAAIPANGQMDPAKMDTRSMSMCAATIPSSTPAMTNFAPSNLCWKHWSMA